MSDDRDREEEVAGEGREADDSAEGEMDAGGSVDRETSSGGADSVDSARAPDAEDPGYAGEPGDASGPAAGYAWTPAWLRALRRDPDRRHVALVAAAIVGLSAAWLHWLGLVLAGGLVGLVSESVTKALAGGLVVGVLVLVVHVGASPVMGAGEFVGLAPAAYVTIGAALVAPLWGSLVRAVV